MMCLLGWQRNKIKIICLEQGGNRREQPYPVVEMVLRQYAVIYGHHYGEGRTNWTS